MERHGLHLCVLFASRLTVSNLTKQIQMLLENRLACGTLPQQVLDVLPLLFAARAASLQDLQHLPGSVYVVVGRENRWRWLIFVRQGPSPIVKCRPSEHILSAGFLSLPKGPVLCRDCLA